MSEMPADDPNSHSASIEVAVPADRAFEFLADGMKQTHWALGSWDRRDLGGGLYSGTSLFDGGELFIRLHGYRDLLLVDYEVGEQPDELRRLVEARIVPGETLDRGADRCVVTITIWRPAGVSADVWARIYHAFNVEVYMIRGRLELDF